MPAQPAQTPYKNISEALQAKSVALLKVTRETTSRIVTDQRNQVTAASAVGGAAVAGTAGAGVGLVACGTLGAAIGVLPAIFTFGLSIPIAAVIGGGCGVVLGGATGSAVGLTGGGAVGFSAYTKRAEIRSLMKRVASHVQQTVRQGKAKASSTYSAVRAHVVSRVVEVTKKTKCCLDKAKAKTAKTAVATTEKAKELAADKAVQVTAASAAGGAVVVGTGGATTGLLAGGAIGAAAGVLPAFFTFGLTIPVFAFIGGGCGLATGAAVGGTAGATVGGAGGYTAFTRRQEIGSAATYLKKTASDSALYLQNKLVGATGGTAE